MKIPLVCLDLVASLQSSSVKLHHCVATTCQLDDGENTGIEDKEGEGQKQRELVEESCWLSLLLGRFFIIVCTAEAFRLLKKRTGMLGQHRQKKKIHINDIPSTLSVFV